MLDFFRNLLSTADFPPRWHCGQWTAAHGWLHILSDLGIWSAYFAIPVTLGYLAWRKQDLPFRFVVVLFVAFILLCGTTHLIEAVIFWWPAYRLAGLVKFVTAVVSWVTVVALARMAPMALAMRSPEALEREISARKHAESRLQQANEELERRVAERGQELAASVERLHRALMGLGTPAMLYADTGDVLLVNRAWTETTGYAPSDLPTIAEWTRRAYGDRQADVTQYIDQLFDADRTVDDGLWEVQTARGERRTWHFYSSPLGREASGRRLVVSNAIDVSDQKRAEALVQEHLSAARTLASIVESSEDAIVSKSLEGVVQSWNAGAERLFGYSADEILGKPVTTFIPAERQDEESTILERIRAGESVAHFDTVRVRRDGQQVHVSLTISPVRDEQGRIIGASKIARDITEQKRLEEQLRQVAADLSEADRRKDEFLATLAHELRNPLAPIRNGLQLMRLTGGEPAHDVREMMERQVEHLVRLVDDLMDVSRISRGKLELKPTQIHLADAVRQAVEASRPVLEPLQHQLTVDLPSAPILLHADMVRLTQVMTNLLTNAAKYSDPGSQITISADASDGLATITVRDNGIGIAPDQLPRIFQMFSQVDRSLERAQGGLGIGLTLVRRLVELHGGSVEAQSVGIGQGSQFIVRLPLRSQGSEGAENTQEDAAELRSGPRRVLVVDDNRDNAETLASLLRSTGHTVHLAFDGEEALRQARALRPDVVLLDLGLPKRNGFEVCRRLRSEAGGHRLLIIAQTGWGTDSDRRRTREAGFNEHLVKPIDAQTLLRLLATWKPAS